MISLSTPFLPHNFRHARWGAVLLLAVFAPSAFADLNAVMGQFQSTGSAINAQLVNFAMKTAIAGFTLQMVLTYGSELLGQKDMSSVVSRTVIMVSWLGFTFLMLNNVDVLAKMFKAYVKMSGNLAGISETDFTPGGMIDQAKLSIKTVHKAVWDAMGDDKWAIGKNIGASITLVFVDVVVLFSYFIVGLTLFVVTLEFWMLFAVMPLALGMIPLQAFRDQGMAPIKGVIALGFRVVILGVVVAVAKSFSASAAIDLPAALRTMSDDYPLLSALGDYMAGIMGCAMMAVYSGKMAATIASGSANFNGADAVRTGMQIVTVGGVAAGAAAATGSAVGGATRGALDGVSGLARSMSPGGNPGVTPPGFSTPGSNVAGMSELRKPLPKTRPSLSETWANREGAPSAGSTSAGTANAGSASAGNNSPGTAGIGGVGNGWARSQGASMTNRVGGGAVPGDSDSPPTTITINTRGGD